ncbi:MAG: hypothetical protein H6650_08990 [Ardenticatenales bacterium]|nr:hypothetical protein [Ardenticatenales bacterium]
MLKNSLEKGNDHWNPFQNGSTIGMKGSERGIIIRDEEHDLGARITLEKIDTGAPYRITSSICGWMIHTSFFSDEVRAISAYDVMKLELNNMLLEKDEINLAQKISKFIQEF